MNAVYTKSSPKIHDYNPITHSPFYSSPNASIEIPPSISKRSSSYMEKFMPRSTKEPIPEQGIPANYPRSPLARSGLLRINNSQSLSPGKYNFPINSPRFYKNKPRLRAVDPIIGVNYSDASINSQSSYIRENFVDYKIQRPNIFKGKDHSEMISNALKKSKPFSNITPSVSKANVKSDLPDPSYQKASEAFFG
ncbi:unnamed protein product [Blepharisma stoltei]|uniref:Uncharacterized protein n=1 Tax=Blepharisma stoltei TaxID=1481888 RepID=A0AAU9IZ36_9CILI|nr:unnamed protein product [Blepharisma stoltei]